MVRLWLCATAAVLATSAAAQDDFALRPNDRVVFYGDSITDNGGYLGFVESFVSLRYPDLKVTFSNAGVGGDRVSGGWMGPIDQRLDRDLFARKPTVVTVMLGMNDGSYRAWEPAIYDAYVDGYRHIVQRLKKEAPETRAWLIRPSPFDDVTVAPSFPGGYNDVLVRYGRFVQRLADRNGYGVINLNAPFVRMLNRAKGLNPAVARQIVQDRVHPGPAGHLLMAAEVLKSWKASPVVAETTIRWGTGNAETVNSTVSGWKEGTFTLLENTLPMPIDRTNPQFDLVLKSSGVAETLNRERLAIRGMPQGTYGLRMNGDVVGVFTASDFARGIDLSVLDTPMMQQARKVVDLTNRLAQLRYNRWRQLEFGFQGTDLKERDGVVRSIQRLESEIVAQRYAAAKPQPVRVQVIKVP